VTSPGTAGAPRFGRGEQVTLFITAEVEAHYEPWEGDENRTVRIRVPGQPRPVLIAYEAAGITLVRGDILPTFRQALKEGAYGREGSLARRKRKGKGACQECAKLPRPTLCGDCAEDAGWRDQFERALDALGASGTEGPAPDVTPP
jgi:hypothetical protein